MNNLHIFCYRQSLLSEILSNYIKKLCIKYCDLIKTNVLQGVADNTFQSIIQTAEKLSRSQQTFDFCGLNKEQSFIQMLRSNCLIFPIPRHYNLSQQVKPIKGHLIYVPKLTVSQLNGSSHLSDLASTSRDELARRFLLQEMEEIDEMKDQSHAVNNKREAKQYHLLGPKDSVRRMTVHSDIMAKSVNMMMNHRDKNKLYIEELKLNNNVHSELSSIKTTARNSNSIKLQTYIRRRSISLIETSRNTQQDKQSQTLTNQTIATHQANSHIPCIHLKCEQNPQQKLFVYYHANAEDLLNSFWFVKELSSYFKADLIVVEYPGYSVYNKNEDDCFGHDTITEQILKDIPPVFEYIKELKYKLQNVTVIGRSIGTGPAIEVGTRYNVRAIVLLSPFADFSQVVQNLYGKLAGMIAPQPFDNFTKSSSIKCPVLIIHGLQDRLIHYEQSVKLCLNIKSYCSLKLISQMTHNRFNYEEDVFANVKEFLTMVKCQQVHQH